MGWIEDELKECEGFFDNPDAVCKCQIMRVGAKLVYRYDDNAAETVADYITPYGNGPIPTFHEFMLWWCDSLTIKREVDFERRMSKLNSC
jgi:hypothetical protein